MISANRPILFLNEPQKLEGAKTLDSLDNFKPLAVFRYWATHKTTHNKIHRMDSKSLPRWAFNCTRGQRQIGPTAHL